MVKRLMYLSLADSAGSLTAVSTAGLYSTAWSAAEVILYSRPDAEIK